MGRRILFLFFIVFCLSFVSSLDGKSFCLEFDYDDDLYDVYDGRCDLYYGEHLFFSGVNVGVEYLFEDSVKLNMNGESFRLLMEGDVITVDILDSKDVILEVYSIWDSKNSSGVSFYYDFDYEGLRDSFCHDDYCILYLGDRLYFGDVDVKFLNITDVGKNCYDLIFSVNSETVEEEDVCLNDAVNMDGVVFNFSSFSDSKGKITFYHNYEWNNYSCLDSDGYDIYLKGNVSGLYGDENYSYGKDDFEIYYFSDYCYSLKPVLVEFYCNSGYIKSEIIICDKCENGACVNFTEEERMEIERIENLGKLDFSSIEVCYEGCLLNDSCYSYGYNLSGSICSREGWIFSELEAVKVSFFRKIWNWLF